MIVRIPRACFGFGALILPLASIAVAGAAPAEQHASAEVEQHAVSNSGINLDISHAPGVNEVEQHASSGEGDAANSDTATNTLAGNAGIASGNAGAGNTLVASVAQSAAAPPAPPAAPEDEAADVQASELDESAEAPPVVQTMSIVLDQAAVANSGGNVSVGVAKGTNDVSQTAESTGPGNAANTNAATNNGTAASSLTTGDATASNSSTISITQTASTP